MSSDKKTSFYKKQTNRDFETLNGARDSQRASYKNRDCETHVTAKKTRLRDPAFLNDHSPPLKLAWFQFGKGNVGNFPCDRPPSTRVQETNEKRKPIQKQNA